MLKINKSIVITTINSRLRLRLRFLSTTNTGDRTGGPEIHSGPTEDSDSDAASTPSKPSPPRPRLRSLQPHHHKTTGTATINPQAGAQPHHPTTQQKRRTRTNTAAAEYPWYCEAAGVDVGKSWGWSEEEREFLRKHKASALENVEVVDTRKPITRVTHGTADSREEGGLRLAVVLEETAEETMARAAEMWRRRREMGDPDSPHGRVLRQLRGQL